jgi:homopolymeric O-antigen transport system ATP-binding protein
MSRPIVICDQISKSYRLGKMRRKGLAQGLNATLTIRDALGRAIQSALQRMKGPKSSEGLFWALQDVSFEVQRGEVVAIIGHNGAGKSTLLKILSRIVEPTRGTARLRGRVASLLEVGTGFHSELTGRENIYLNGAMLGMKKAEIQRKFDEIVAFSEIEEFLDTPVKRYSSGMYVRLAFAVAAHLEPDILIVDEVLAVGDYAFQKKCLGKMHDVATADGRTILFVSHNMSALTQLCEHGILLEDGQVRTIGPVRDVIQTYLKSKLNDNTAHARFSPDPSKPCQYVSAEIFGGDGDLRSDFSCDEPVTIRLRFEIRRPVYNLSLSFYIQNLDGTRVIFSDIRDRDPSVTGRLSVGVHTFEVTIPPRLLAPTTYLLSVSSLMQGTGVIDQHDACCEFSFQDLSLMQIGLVKRSSVLGVLLPWNHESARISMNDDLSMSHSPLETET